MLPDHLQKIQDSRESVYGHWRANMAGTSWVMCGLLQNLNACQSEENEDTEIPDWWAPLMMVAVKLNRIASGNFKQDNFDDLKVYLSFVETMQKEKSDE